MTAKKMSRQAQLEAELAFERGLIFALSRDLADEWKRNQALLEELAQLRGVIENYQRFTGGVDVEPASNDIGDGTASS